MLCVVQAALAAEGAIGKLLNMMREADSSASREAGIKALKVPECRVAMLHRVALRHTVLHASRARLCRHRCESPTAPRV